MAIAQMTKLQLVGVSYERQLLLNALADTGAVQIKCGEEEYLSASENADVTILADKQERLLAVVEFLEDAIRKSKKGLKISTDCIDVPFDDFLKVADKRDEVEHIADEVEKIQQTLALNAANKNKLTTLLAQIRRYSCIDAPFSSIKNTKKVKFHLGTLSADAANKILAYAAEECQSTVVEICGTSDVGTVVFVACHASENEKISLMLGELNFVRCPFDVPVTAKQREEELLSECLQLEKIDNDLAETALSFADKLPLLKLYADRLNFEKQKQTYSVNFNKTAATFTLEAYVPTQAKDFVSQRLAAATDALYFGFEEIANDEQPPTLMQNKKITTQFECVTNLYSVPAYREFDPNTLVGIFFSVFFGFIMADMGYGVLLAVAGLLFASRIKRDTGVRRLLYVRGIGGIFTFIFGFLFGGFFGLTRTVPGFEWLPVAIIPDPVTNCQEVLLYSLLGGAVHLMFGYISKGLSCIKQKQVWDGIWDGFVWALFFVGMICLFPMAGKALFDVKLFGIQNIPPLLNYIGFGICGGVVFIQIFASGRHAKGFGKFTSGFGAVYGLINFFSDLLSYARLYGLMLSGAMIANIVSTMSIGLMHSGVGGIIGAVVILVVGHGFNIAMGVLGAYIHDARLQFIEYFGKFYEGNGELFTPLGAKLTFTELKHITATTEKK